MRIIKRFAAAFVALCCCFAMCAAPALAAVDYPRTEYWSSADAAWTFLQQNGLSADVPDFDTNNQFVRSIANDTTGPFYRFCLNYVQLVPALNGYLSSWRVLQSVDIDGFEAKNAYEDLLNASIAQIENDWAAWVEEYPGAGGGSSGSGSGEVITEEGAIYVLHVNNLVAGTYTFTDGTLVDVPASFVDSCAQYGATQFVAVVGKSAQGGRINWNGTGRVNGSFAVNINPLFNRPSAASADNVGASWAVCLPGPVGSLDYVTSHGSFMHNNSGVVPGSLNGFPDWYPSGYNGAVLSPGAFGNSVSKYNYVFTNCPVYSWGSLLFGDEVGPSPAPDPDAPSGPSSPEYPSPEPYEPTSQQPGTIVNNVTNNTTTYTGSETDYSDFLRIIIDNQNEQIGQIFSFSEMVADAYTAFSSWLMWQWNELFGYLSAFQDYFSTLLDWESSSNGFLFSILEELRDFRRDANEIFGVANDLLSQILAAIPSGSGGGDPSYPDVTVDPGDDAGGFFGWLLGLLSEIVDLLIGSVDDISGLADDVSELSGVFPFSIPWDLAAVIGLLVAEPVADYVIQWPILDGATSSGGVTWSLAPVDLSAFSDIFSFIRFGFLGLVAIGLAYKTKDALELLGKVVG